MNKIGLYPGSFDPLTFGHLDLIERGAKLFDKLYIAISKNGAKTSLFTALERVEMVKKATKHLQNVEVVMTDLLMSEFASLLGVNALLRGLRAITDFEYELQMASTNHMLNPKLETVFMMTKTEYSFFSSSMVKEIARFNGDITKFVPDFIAQKIIEKNDILRS